jgi:transposase
LSALILARLAHKKTGGQAAQALGRSRGGFSCKIHVAADGLGLPLRIRLTAGQCHDSTQAQALMAGLDCDHAVADRAYAAQAFIDWLIERGILPVIPPHQRAKLAREYDTWLYRERHLVECLVNKFKHFRRIFSRFDKLASRYLGFLHFVGALLWLR